MARSRDWKNSWTPQIHCFFTSRKGNTSLLNHNQRDDDDHHVR